MACNCNNNSNFISHTSCMCPVKDLSTDCISYTGDRLNCLEVENNTLLTEVLESIDEKLCTNTSQGIQSINEGLNISIDNTDPLNPIINSVDTNTTNSSLNITRSGNEITITIVDSEGGSISNSFIDISSSSIQNEPILNLTTQVNGVQNGGSNTLNVDSFTIEVKNSFLNISISNLSVNPITITSGVVVFIIPGLIPINYRPLFSNKSNHITSSPFFNPNELSLFEIIVSTNGDVSFIIHYNSNFSVNNRLDTNIVLPIA